MTRDEAEALLVERNGDVCVRYFQRHDGTILLADCSVGVSRRRRRRLIAAGAATLLASGAAAAALRSNPRCSGSGEMVMGAISVAHTAPAEPTQVEPPMREIKGKYEGAPAPQPTMGKPTFK